MVDIVKVDKLPWEKAAAPANSVTQVKKLPWVNPTGAKVVRQKAGVFTGDEYEPGGMDNPKNKATFENTGEPLTVFGVPVLDWRKQTTSTNESEKRTKFVPKAIDNDGTPIETNPDYVDTGNILTDFKSNANSDFKRMMRIDDEGNPDPNAPKFNPGQTSQEFERVVSGGALELVKSSIDFGLWMLENTAKLTGPQLDGNEMDVDGTVVNNTTDPETEIEAMRQKFNEEFPTMPAANTFEKTAQEMIPMVIGYASGRKIGQDISKEGETYIKVLADFYNNVRKLDPATAKSKTELLAKAILTELSGNAGAAITAPEDVTSLSQNFGVVPQDIGGDKYAANKLGQFVDNNALSVGFKFIGDLLGIPFTAIAKKVFSGNPTDQVNIANKFMRVIDEDVTDATPPEELGRRIEILSEVINNNKAFNFAVNGNDMSINLDATSAILLGAKDYMRQVYKKEELALSEEFYDDFITKKAQDMVEKMMYLKQSLKANPVVATSDTNVLAGFTDGLKKISDSTAMGPLPSNRGSKEQVVAGAKDFFGKPVAEALNAPVPNDLATLAATAARDDEMSKNTLIQMLEDARANNMLGSNAAERAELENMVGDQLYANLLKDQKVVDDAFKSVKANVDPNEFALVIQEAGDIKGFMDAAGLSPKERTLVQPRGDVVTDPLTGKVIEDPLEDLSVLIEEKGYTDLTTVVRDLRPKLARQRDDIKGSRDIVNKNTEQLDYIIDWIDQQANSAGPEFQKAMDKFKRFSDKWTESPPLKEFVETAREVRDIKTSGVDGPVETIQKGGLKMRQAGMKAFLESKDAFTDEVLVKFLQAVRGPTVNNKSITQALLAQTINQLAVNRPASSTVKAVDILGAVQPLLRSLEVAGDVESVRLFKEAAEQLQMAEVKLGVATNKDKVAENAYKLLQAKAIKSAAYEFVYKDAVPSRVVDDKAASNAFKQIFEAPQSIDKVGELVTQAEIEGNQLAVDGLRAELIDWLKTKIFTKKGVGGVPSDEGVRTIRDASSAQLASIFEDQGNPVLPMLEKAFATDPKTGKALVQIMQMLHGFVNGRATRVNTFGSTTVVDAELQRSVNLLITLTLGVLNPTATKARGIAGVMLAGTKQNSEEAVKYVMSQMATDPKFLTESLELLKNDKTGNSWMAKFGNNLGIANNAMFKAGFTSAKPTVEQQTEEAIPMNKGMQ